MTPPQGYETPKRTRYQQDTVKVNALQVSAAFEEYHAVLARLHHATLHGSGVVVGLGVTIGAHTVSHPILSQLSPEEARAEIEGSRAAIRSRSGRAPQAFAYPNGGPADYGDAVVSMVRDAGFTCAVTTRFGVNTAATPPYELRRGGPWEHHLPTFALKLAGYRLTEA